VTGSDYMNRALFHAARGRGRTTPNPVVGAVVVTPDGVVVGHGSHERSGEAHAEVLALAMAGSRARGATLYCTLEPCSHVGRTGPCVSRIVEAGIARVVASVEDPNPLVRGRGFAYLRGHGVVVEVGVGAAEATRLNRPFFSLIRDRRPFVTLKAATSLDGCIAEAPGRRTLLSSKAARRHSHVVRAAVDAIAVGIGTVLVDDPRLTARGPFRERPLARVVFDRRLRMPLGARLLSTRAAGPVIIMTTAEAAQSDRRRELEALGAEIVVTDGSVSAGLRALGDRQIGWLLLEGGAALHAAAWDERVVDQVCLYVAPRALGPHGVRLLSGRPLRISALEDLRVEPIGPDVLMEGYVHRSR
jgi:diaminohydroxyphosphoribosylaminopyrimidine deaminase/5-amino-6-(5-phosphoribosylamino)uracil reductase